MGGRPRSFRRRGTRLRRRPGAGRGEYFLGSKEFARLYAVGVDDQTLPYRYSAGIVLDMVGGRDLRLDQEENSLNLAPGLVREVWGVARQLKATGLQIAGSARRSWTTTSPSTTRVSPRSTSSSSPIPTGTPARTSPRIARPRASNRSVRFSLPGFRCRGGGRSDAGEAATSVNGPPPLTAPTLPAPAGWRRGRNALAQVEPVLLQRAPGDRQDAVPVSRLVEDILHQGFQLGADLLRLGLNPLAATLIIPGEGSRPSRRPRGSSCQSWCPSSLGAEPILAQKTGKVHRSVDFTGLGNL